MHTAQTSVIRTYWDVANKGLILSKLFIGCNHGHLYLYKQIVLKVWNYCLRQSLHSTLISNNNEKVFYFLYFFCCNSLPDEYFFNSPSPYSVTRHFRRIIASKNSSNSFSQRELTMQDVANVTNTQAYELLMRLLNLYRNKTRSPFQSSEPSPWRPILSTVFSLGWSTWWRSSITACIAEKSSS